MSTEDLLDLYANTTVFRVGALWRGLGFDGLGIHLQSAEEDYPAINLRGNAEFTYIGLQAYLRVYF